jgi:hypothetical protein
MIQGWAFELALMLFSSAGLVLSLHRAVEIITTTRQRWRQEKERA